MDCAGKNKAVKKLLEALIDKKAKGEEDEEWEEVEEGEGEEGEEDCPGAALSALTLKP